MAQAISISKFNSISINLLIFNFRLVTWYDWFNTTQVGDTRGAYRWRGRNASAARELNPKTLTSGLDDYPRASHPTVDERHVDLRCWMALASQLMADIGQLLGRRDTKKFADTAAFLSDNARLDAMHWSVTQHLLGSKNHNFFRSVSHQAYMDWGLHTDDVILARPKAPPHAHPSHVPTEKVGCVKSCWNICNICVQFIPYILVMLYIHSWKPHPSHVPTEKVCFV